MTLRVLNGGGGAEPPDEPEFQPPTPDASTRLYTEFAKVIEAGGYQNRDIITAAVCILAHSCDSAGCPRLLALPEIIRIYVQLDMLGTTG